MDSPTPGGLPVKCRLEEGAFSETRMLLLRRLELAELHCKVGWLFKLMGHYQLRYMDRFGDLITFSSEEEFQLALANHMQPEFRILITPVASPALLQLHGEAKTAYSFPPALPGAAVKSTADSGAVAKVAKGNAGPSAVVKTATGANGLADSVAEKLSFRRPEGKKSHSELPPATPPPDVDWEAVFHPGYLKPRTSTARKFGRRRPTLDVQASLAGYPSDVLSAAQHPEKPGRQQQPPPLPPPPPCGRGDFVHFGIGCCRCGVDPLIGWRFKCSQCPNYNLCSVCFDSYSHGHGFYRLP